MAEDKGTQAVAVAAGEVSPEQMREIEAGEYFTIPQIATTFRYSRARITQLVQQGRIRAIKPVGGQWRIPKSEFERLSSGNFPPMPKAVKKPPVAEIEVPPDKVTKIAPEPSGAGGRKEKMKFPWLKFELFGEREK